MQDLRLCSLPWWESVSVHMETYTIYTSSANIPSDFSIDVTILQRHSLGQEFPGLGRAAGNSFWWQELHVLLRQGVKTAPVITGPAAPGNSPIRDDAAALLVVEDCSSGLFLKK